MKKTKYLTFAAVALMLVACSQNEEPVLQEKEMPITIASAGMNELVASRAATPLTSGSLGLYVTGTDLDVKYTASNVEWTYNNEWQSQGEKVLFAGAGKQSAYAYHPYAPSAYTDGFPTDGTTDLLWWKSESTLAAASFPIEFTHALSKLTIDLKKGSEVPSDIMSVTVVGTKLTGTPNFAAQTWTVDANTAAADIATTSTTITSGKDATYTVLLIPQTTSALKVVITTSDDRIFAYTHNGSQTFAAGHAYTLALTVGGDAVKTGGIVAANWSQVNSDNLVTE